MTIIKYACLVLILSMGIAASGCIVQVPDNDNSVNTTQQTNITMPMKQTSVPMAPKQLYIYPNDVLNFMYRGHNISIKYLTSSPQQEIWLSLDGKEKTILENRTDCMGGCGSYWQEGEITISVRPVVWESDPDNDGSFGEDPLDGIDNDGDGLIDEDTVDKVWSFDTWDTDELYIEIT